MHDEYKNRARKHGLTCESWTSSNQRPSSQLILVAVENCVWDEFKSYAETLICLGRLSRIVVDEAHLIHTHGSFRPCVEMLEHLGRMPISILLMTATCPPNLEQSLFAKLGRQVYQVLRRGTDRPEIAQSFVALSSKDLEKNVATQVQSITQQFRKQDRALLFCWSHDECDRMAELLGWKPYHASILLDDRARYKKMWEDGDFIGLACTSMLNCCLDHPTIRTVFHLGPPRDVMEYSQAVGRAARNGERGKSIVYFDPTRLKKPTGEDPYGRCIIYDMLRDSSTCRRLRPSIFLDGYATPCSMLPGAQLCDICEAESTCAPPEGCPPRFPTHLLPTLSGSHTAESARILAPGPSMAQTSSQPQQQPRVLNPLPSNSVNRPAPLATFGNHFAAAQTALKIARVPPTYAEKCGLEIHTACQALTGSCVHCWAHGIEYHSHSLVNCQLNRINEMHPEWKTWSKSFRLPVGCCFFCGCQLKVL
jgi:Helicase conserved C-terminal domain